MKNLLILALFTLPLSSFARKPAVEPVTGISIDEYKEVPPSQAQGYNWNKKNTESLKVKENTAPQVKGDVSALPEREISSTTGPNLTPAIVLFFMLILPFGIWYFLLGKLDEPETEIGFQEEEEDNTLAFPSKSHKKDDEDDDDFDIPKAS